MGITFLLGVMDALLLDIRELDNTFARYFAITMPLSDFADGAVFSFNDITLKQDMEDMPRDRGF